MYEVTGLLVKSCHRSLISFCIYCFCKIMENGIFSILEIGILEINDYTDEQKEGQKLVLKINSDTTF